MVNYQNVEVDENKWELDTTSTAEKSLQLFITNRCNLGCTNCFSQNLNAQEKKDMTVENALSLVKNNPDYYRINFMGGEPTIHNDIGEIISGTKKLGRRAAVFTNATLLKRLENIKDPFRLSVSFHDLENKDQSRKPIVPKLDELHEFNNNGKDVKLIFLIDKQNAGKVNEIVNHIDKTQDWVKILRIGLMRDEADYFNDNAPNVVSFAEYRNIVQNLVNTYNGRLNFEFLTKGVLLFNGQGMDKCSVDRFRNIFPDMTYSDCVLGSHCKKPVPESRIFLPSHNACMQTKKNHCLIYKARLYQKEI